MNCQVREIVALIKFWFINTNVFRCQKLIIVISMTHITDQNFAFMSVHDFTLFIFHWSGTTTPAVIQLTTLPSYSGTSTSTHNLQIKTPLSEVDTFSSNYSRPKITSSSTLATVSKDISKGSGNKRAVNSTTDTPRESTNMTLSNETDQKSTTGKIYCPNGTAVSHLIIRRIWIFALDIRNFIFTSKNVSSWYQ